MAFQDDFGHTSSLTGLTTKPLRGDFEENNSRLEIFGLCFKIKVQNNQIQNDVSMSCCFGDHRRCSSRTVGVGPNQPFSKTGERHRWSRRARGGVIAKVCTPVSTTGSVNNGNGLDLCGPLGSFYLSFPATVLQDSLALRLCQSLSLAQTLEDSRFAQGE